MRLEEGKAELVITPNSQFAKKFIETFIKSKGTHQLNDAIKEAISTNGYSHDDLTFYYYGTYPNHFKSYEEARIFKESLEDLVSRTNSKAGNLKVKNIDDILFLTYFLVGHDGDVYSSNANSKYLDDLIDVFISLYDRELTPKEGDYIWVSDAVTGIETQALRNEFDEETLKMNQEYKTVSRMIGADNAIFHLPNDSTIIIDKRFVDKEPIVLPKRLSEKINAVVVDHIIEEHKKVDSKFYRDLCSGYVDTRQWRDRTKARAYKRSNKVLYPLIKQIHNYFESICSLELIKSDVQIFVYDLFVLLNLIRSPHKIDPTDKYSVIRTIIKDNDPSKGK